MLVLASFIFCAIGAFFLVRQEVRSVWAGLVGSLVFAYAPRVFVHSAYGHFSHVATWTLPLVAIALRRAFASGSRRAGLAAGALWALTASIDPQKGAFVALLVGLLAVAETQGFGLRGG